MAAVSAVRNYLSNALAKPGTRARIHAIRVATDAGCWCPRCRWPVGEPPRPGDHVQRGSCAAALPQRLRVLWPGWCDSASGPKLPIDPRVGQDSHGPVGRGAGGWFSLRWHWNGDRRVYWELHSEWEFAL